MVVGRRREEGEGGWGEGEVVQCVVRLLRNSVMHLMDWGNRGCESTNVFKTSNLEKVIVKWKFTNVFEL